ncbi:NAD-dependent protein deacetylase sirtuin-2 [Gamsiella multidivaricata]|nr:NAD-dependent protein deacetylase sirtuin-2 [Gamsiella multidivaricata]
MTGAGISTAAGIKDFRSPGTGLYDDLEKYNLPFPEAVFDLTFFKPTLTHYLLPLLAKKNLLLRSYTQNIDSLERLAGLDEGLLVEAHGSFASSKCVQCEMTTDPVWVKRHIMAGDIPYCKRCSGLVKPSITFFGENVPLRFSAMAETDFEKCDLLIVLGTSLKVEPFNKLISKVSPKCPRLLINREIAGQELHSGFDFDDKLKYTVQRDALFLGNCDDGVKKLAALCGWEDELQAMYDVGHTQLDLDEEKEKLELAKAKQDDEDDESENEDLDPEDDTDRKATNEVLDSTDNLDEITDRFKKSTILSQSEENQLNEGLVDSKLEKADANFNMPQMTINGKSEHATHIHKESASESAKAGGPDSESRENSSVTTSKDATPLITPNDRPSLSSAAKSGETHQDALQAEASQIPDTEPLITRNIPSMTPSSSETIQTLAPEYPEATNSTTVATESLDLSGPKAVTKELASGESEDKKDGAEAIADRIDSAADDAKPVSDSAPSSPAQSRGSPVYTPMVPLTDIGSSTALMTSLASPISIYTPLSVAAASPSHQQPFPTCIPVTTVCPNTASETAVIHGAGCDSFTGSTNGGIDSSSGMGSNGSGGRADGAGSLQVRRKRPKDFESAGNTGLLKSEFRYLRGLKMVPPHYLSCGRVTKRRRVM